MSDPIERQDAIEVVKRQRKMAWENYHETRPSAEQIIEDLKELPSAQSTVGQQNDGVTIYKQDAINAALECRVIEVTPAHMLIDKTEMATKLLALPSAQQKKKNRNGRDSYGRLLVNGWHLEVGSAKINVDNDNIPIVLSVDIHGCDYHGSWFSQTIMPSAQSKRKTCGLMCLRCKQTYEYSWDTMNEISYTMYSYCPDCIRKGIQLLKSQDKEGDQDD